MQGDAVIRAFKESAIAPLAREQECLGLRALTRVPSACNDERSRRRDEKAQAQLHGEGGAVSPFVDALDGDGVTGHKPHTYSLEL